MKNLSTLLMLISYFAMPARCSYIPLCFNGHSYEYKYDNGLGGNRYFLLTMQCDTIFDSKSYYKVLYPGGKYMGAIREDSIAHKVFFLPADSLSEFLAFDFSLLKNDFFHFIFDAKNYEAHVDSVKIEFQYGQNRKVIYFDLLPPIIEGIGSSNWGLHSFPIAKTGMLATSKLITSTKIDVECLPTNIIDNEIDNDKVIFYPNPVIDNLYIRFGFNPKNQHIYRIFDNKGYFIESGYLLENYIPFEDKPSGLYIVQMQIDKSVFSQYINKP